MIAKFELGQTVQTRGIAAACENSEAFTKEINYYEIASNILEE